MSVANLFNHAGTLGNRHRAYSAGATTWIKTAYGAVSGRLKWTLFVLSFVALSVSSYLAMVAFTSGTVAGCGSGSVFDCDHVLHSRWSKVLWVPVSVLAIVNHVVLLSALLSRPQSEGGQRLCWAVVSFAAFAAGGAALWFIGLQVFWLQHLCPYCLVAHVAGLLIAALVLWVRPIDRQTSRWAASAAVLSLAGLIAVQSATEPPPTFTVVETPAMIGPVENADSVLFDAPDMFAAPGMSAAPGMNTAQDTAADAGTTSDAGTSADPSTTSNSSIFEAPTVDASSSAIQTSATPRLEYSLADLFAPHRNQLAHHANELTNSIGQAWQLAMAVMNPAILVSSQVAAAGSPANAPTVAATPAAEQPTVTVLQNIKLNTNQWPIVGNPNAELVFVELFDYTCPHCQKTHVAIDGAMKKYGDRLAVVVLPVPLNRQCNPSAKSTHAMHREACELARLAIALWTVDREQFAAFHDYLFDAKPTYAAAKAKAMQMVDQQQLTQAMSSTIASDYIAKHVALYQKAGAGTIPKLLFPTIKIEGEVSSPEALSQLIEQHLSRR